MKEILVDYSKRCGDEPEKGHNRWHPDIPPAVRADQGEEVVMQTRHAFDGQITPGTQAPDLLNTDLGLVHPLTGPVYVNGAEPGDLLEVNDPQHRASLLGVHHHSSRFRIPARPVSRALHLPLADE